MKSHRAVPNRKFLEAERRAPPSGRGEHYDNNEARDEAKPGRDRLKPIQKCRCLAALRTTNEVGATTFFISFDKSVFVLLSPFMIVSVVIWFKVV